MSRPEETCRNAPKMANGRVVERADAALVDGQAGAAGEGELGRDDRAAAVRTADVGACAPDAGHVLRVSVIPSGL